MAEANSITLVTRNKSDLEVSADAQDDLAFAPGFGIPAESLIKLNRIVQPDEPRSDQHNALCTHPKGRDA
jgi:hypothetical protein